MKLLCWHSQLNYKQTENKKFIFVVYKFPIKEKISHNFWLNGSRFHFIFDIDE